MNPVISCPTTETLQWFLARNQTSVVFATALPIESVFPYDVRQTLTNEPYAPDLGVATPDALRGVIGRNVEQDEILVFTVSSLIGSFCDRPKNFDGAMVELFRIFDQNYQAEKQARKINAVRRLVLLANDEHLKSRKEHVTTSSHSDPYEILGLTHGASLEEIRVARRRLIAQYHPDKVAQLGDKIREVAEVETKKINAAYEEIKRRAAEAPFLRTRRYGGGR